MRPDLKHFDKLVWLSTKPLEFPLTERGVCAADTGMISPNRIGCHRVLHVETVVLLERK